MLITNCRTYIDGKISEKEILILDGKIARIAGRIPENEAGGEEKINAGGLMVIPGLIDVHVHLREPGSEYKEDFVTGTKAALAGGITTVIDMPNNKVPTTTLRRLREKEELAQKKALCDVRFYMGATNDNFAEIKKANPIAVKVYMGKTTGDLLVTEDEIMERHFSNFDRKKPITVHAEDQKYMEAHSGKRTEEAAEIAVKRAVTLAEKTKRKLHIAHASTSQEIEIAKEKAGGQKLRADVSVETAPHYLFLSQKDADKLKQLGTVNPPLRSEETRKALWKKLNNIDCIATDHAPHTLEDKGDGARGFPGLETSLALMLDAYNKRMLELDWIISRMTENPAEIFGLTNLGRIAVGFSANLTFVDLKKEWTVNGEELETKCKWSPFEGKKLRGKAVKTVFGGRTVYEDNEIC
ncbi:MAG: dihydroorotase family protein [Candidatus Micrarchaeota archaeon]